MTRPGSRFGPLEVGEVASQLLAPASGHALEAPIRSVLFGAARFAEHGRSLARAQEIVPPDKGRGTFFPRLQENLQVLRDACSLLEGHARQGHHLAPAAGWLIDHVTLLAGQADTVRGDLPLRYFQKLPRLRDKPLAGLPRIYGLAWAWVAHTDSGLDEDLLELFLGAYQRQRELTLAELWAVPTTLRVVLIENLRRLAESAATLQSARDAAHRWVERPAVPGDTARLEDIGPALARRGVLEAFALQLQRRVDELGAEAAPDARAWLATHLPDPAGALQRQQQQQAEDHQSVRNAVTSLRGLDRVDWRGVLLRSSAALADVQRLPVFAAESEGTQDLTLQDIERLARRAAVPESRIGAAVARLAGGAGAQTAAAIGALPEPAAAVVPTAVAASSSASTATPTPAAATANATAPVAASGRPAAPLTATAAPQYWLRGAGRPVLMQALGLPDPRAVLRATARRAATPAYLLTVAGATAGLVALLISRGAAPGLPGWALALTALLLAGPASEAVLAVLHRLISESLPPKRLPRMALDGGIPPSHRTLVVMPVMLTGTGTVAALAAQMEQHHLANPERHAQFALLTDFTDAEQQQMPADAALLQAAHDAVAQLNAAYPVATGEALRFLLLHRGRTWSDSEQTWIGDERKRGKLEALLAGLAGSPGSPGGSAGAGAGTPRPFTDFGPLSTPAAGIRSVVTLDSDTDMPPGRLRELVSIHAHPLNAPVLDAAGRRVVAGYAILQPRIVVPLPRPGSVTPFHWLFSGQWGVDPYSAASSEIYQDLFGEGTFTGKGLLDVQAVHTLLAGRLPRERVLSHDLLEGALARCAAVSDVTLVEDAPAHPDVAASRVHRWTRGDWQLLPFIVQPRRWRMAGINRWKMFDNLRRSLVAPSALALLLWVLATGALPLAAALALVAAAYGAGPLLGALAGLAPPRDDIALGLFFRRAGAELLRSLVGALWFGLQLAAHARSSADAAVRALHRRFVSHRHLLQWTTAAAAQAAARTDLAGLWLRHRKTSALALGACGGLVALRLSGFTGWADGSGGGGGGGAGSGGSATGPGGAPATGLAPLDAVIALCAVWAAAPLWTWLASRPLPASAERLDAEGRQRVQDLAHDTWGWYARWVGADDHHLPPDNVQLTGDTPMVAHRTSPTNIGLYLLGVAAAREMGFIGAAEMLQRLQDTLQTLDRLPRWRGHFYNWIDTRTLATLLPAYVSTVDSGNLSGHLLVLSAACEALADEADGAAGPARAAGATDTAGAAAATAPALAKGATGAADPTSRSDAPPAAGAADPADATDGAHRTGPVTRARAAEMIDAGQRTLARDIAAHARRLALAADFRVLYDPKRRLLHIGIDPESQRLDASHYDLLASEARLASLVAIAKGDLPPRHWSALARPLFASGGRVGLRSWSGSMFEYLMPSLVLPEPAGSLLFDATRTAVEVQQADAAPRGTPWGVSESAIAVQDHTLAYQYGPQGVASLALRRTTDDERVIAPYASAMALVVAPQAAADNLAALEALGARIEQGYIEALDYTPYRQPAATAGPASSRAVAPTVPSGPAPRSAGGGKTTAAAAGTGPGAGTSIGTGTGPETRPGIGLDAKNDDEADTGIDTETGIDTLQGGALPARTSPTFTPVRTLMAHHQGMSLLACAHVLTGAAVQRWAARQPYLRAVLPLLHERSPHLVPMSRMRPPAPLPRPLQGQRWQFECTPQRTSLVPTHVLGNDRYAVLLRANGAGCSQWQGQTLSRWRDDKLRDAHGLFGYVMRAHDTRWHALSAHPAPPPGAAENPVYRTEFHPDRALLHARFADLSVTTTVSVSPTDDCELRRVQLHNPGRRPLRLVLALAFEPTLAPQRADETHPAFSNLFVQARWSAEERAMFLQRRPRLMHEQSLHAVQFIAACDDPRARVQALADRTRWLGRLGSATAPLPGAWQAGGAGVAGIGADIDPDTRSEPTETVLDTGLDPACVLMVEVTVPARGSRELTFVLAAAHDELSLRALVDRYQRPAAAERALGLSDTLARIRLRELRLDLETWVAWLHLNTLVLGAVTRPRLATVAEVGLGGEAIDRRSLYRHGIGGDRPIVLVWIETTEGLDLARQVVAMLALWTAAGQALDLVVVNAEPASYLAPVQQGFTALAEQAAQQLQAQLPPERRSVLKLLKADDLPPSERATLRLLARLWLQADGRALEQQINRARTVHDADRLMRARQPRHAPKVAQPRADAQAPVGVFDAGDAHFRFELTAGRYPLRPWINVLANPGFGTQVSESAAGFTWAGNSRMHQITAGANDALADLPAEALWLHDLDAQRVWWLGRGAEDGDGTDRADGPPALAAARSSMHAGTGIGIGPRTGTGGNSAGGPREVVQGIGYTRMRQVVDGLAVTLEWCVDVETAVKQLHVNIALPGGGATRHLRLVGYAEWTMGASRGDRATVVTQLRRWARTEATAAGVAGPGAPGASGPFAASGTAGVNGAAARPPLRATGLAVLATQRDASAGHGGATAFLCWRAGNNGVTPTDAASADAAATKTAGAAGAAGAARTAGWSAAEAGLSSAAPSVWIDADDWTCDRREFFDGGGRWVLPEQLMGRAGAGLDPCGGVACRLTVAPGRAVQATLLLGHADSAESAARLAQDASAVAPDERLTRQLAQWPVLLDAVQVATPDPLFDALVNRWLPYQAIACRLWARAGFYQAGGAYGFRDQLQDAMNLADRAPQLLQQQIRVHAARQFEEGDVQHWWHPPGGAGVRTRMTDDLLWLPLALAHAVQRGGHPQGLVGTVGNGSGRSNANNDGDGSGDGGRGSRRGAPSPLSLLDEQVPFLQGNAVPPDKEDIYETPASSEHTASLYEHGARAIDLVLQRRGAHGLPLMGTGDWNDGMNRVGFEGRGESVWLGWFLCRVIDDYAPLAEARGRAEAERAGRWRTARTALAVALDEAGWDGAWYRRAFFDDGSPLGSAANTECRIDLIAQAWAVLSGAGDPQRAAQAMDSARELLWDSTARVMRLLDPPLARAEPEAGYIQAYPGGIRENGGQYNHAAVWALMAFAQQGDGAWAWKMFEALSPAHRSADPVLGPVYALEPYVLAGDIYSQPPWAGRGGWSWYTGAASWLQRAALESICGLRIANGMLTLEPCLPPHWPQVELMLRHGGRTHRVLVVRGAARAHQAIATSPAGQPVPVLLQPGKTLALDTLADGSHLVVQVHDAAVLPSAVR